MITIKDSREIELMRHAGHVVGLVHKELEKFLRPGLTTQEVADFCEKIIRNEGCTPSFLHLYDFPGSVCTSVNDTVVHGIPSNYVLKDGDIVNVDCSTILNGYFSDSSRMFCIGNVDPSWKKLVDVTKECVQIGMEHVKPWTFLGDMGNAVHQHALDNGYSVVREIGGHGCGCEFHEDPYVSYVSKPGTEMLMVPGMCFTIEPMVNMGTDRIYEDDSNGWSIYTDDGKPSAQWEVQVLVTDDGYELITY